MQYKTLPLSAGRVTNACILELWESYQNFDKW